MILLHYDIYKGNLLLSDLNRKIEYDFGSISIVWNVNACYNAFNW